jgi:D-citramalate synthase
MRKQLAPNFVRKPEVWDSSLRDGQQTPGVFFTTEAKRMIARCLRNYGVDVIEAGSPCSGPGEIKAVRAVCDELGSGKNVAAFARAVNKDVDAVVASGAGIVALVFPSSDLHIKEKFRTSRRGAESLIMKPMEYAMRKNLRVELLAEDGSRADPDFLAKIALRAQDLGVSGFCICDTVGVLDPDLTHALFEFLMEQGAKNLSFHGHNDTGLAVANTLAALHAGAVGFQGTINGLGERCGNCPIEQVALLLQRHHGIRTVKLASATKVSRLVAGLSDFYPASNQPVVGGAAFAHKAGIHTAAIYASGGAMYEPFDPALVGSKRTVTLSAQSGLKGIKYKLEELGLKLPARKIGLLLDKVRKMGEAGNDVSDADFIMLVRALKGNGPHKVTVAQLNVNTGTTATPTATVFLKFNGHKEAKFGASSGDGPVDAAIKAVNKALGKRAVKLLSYHVDSIIGGSDASVRVSVEVRLGSRTIRSSAVGTDIVLVSVDAYVKAVNVLL